MSVASSNPFSLLADDIEDPDVPAPAAAAVPPAPAKEATTKQSTSSKKIDAAPKSARPENARTRPPRNNASEDAFRDKNAGRAANRSRAPPAEGASSDRPRRGRGPREGGAPSGRRQFDRHSGAVPDSNKQVAESWGSAATEQKDEQFATDFAAAEVAAPGDALASGDAVAAAAASSDAAPLAEELDNSKTYEEYLQELEAKSAELGPKLPIRKANEGEDPSSWGSVLQAKSEVAESDFISLKPKKETKQKATKKEKTTLDFEPTFTPPPSAASSSRRGGRGDRSDRGPGRGGRGGSRGGRGGNRPPSTSHTSTRAAPAAPASVNLSSTADFPSL
ncbi:uncharacterized protein V1518DRAFT_418085 [Limtongia smithiae]|uniref:uncharacterized protein n=1 Tax=Limtongia smithiae TaxID=1125753 RepID=UPI0034CD762B